MGHVDEVVVSDKSRHATPLGNAMINIWHNAEKDLGIMLDAEQTKLIAQKLNLPVNEEMYTRPKTFEDGWWEDDDDVHG